MRWLQNRSKKFVGIDIGVNYIKLLEVEHAQEHFIVQQYAIAEFPITVLTDKQEVKNKATINSTIIQLRDQSNITADHAVIAVPGASVVTNQIFLNNDLSEAEMETQAWLEASKHFPDLLEDLSLDFHIIGPAANEKNQVEALLVACRKSSIENLVNAFDNSRFKIDIVDVDYYALERILRYFLKQQDSNPQQAYALLNLDSYASTLVVIADGRLIYAHDQAFEGQKLLQDLQQEKSWSNILLHPEQMANANLTAENAVIDTIISHVNYALELFYSSKHEINLQKIFLAGDCAIIPQLAELVQQKTGVETATINPLLNMQISNNVDAAGIQAIAPALALCCGLALHEEKA